jgi:sporulation protein YlmC with PRC-barrel domain
MAETHGMEPGPTGSPTSSSRPDGENSFKPQGQSQSGGSAGNSNRSTGTMDDTARSASEMTQSASEQRRQSTRHAGERYPQARRYLERGTQVVSEAPVVSLLAVGAVGLALAWMMGGGRSSSEDRTSYRARGRRDHPGLRTGKRLIESDRVEGTAVYDRSGKRIGTIERVMLDKITGRAAYAVMSFGGFLGLGKQEFAVPWSLLNYDTSLEGFQTNLREEQLRNAPSFSRDQGHDWSDRASERQLHDYYHVTYYWLAP